MTKKGHKKYEAIVLDLVVAEDGLIAIVEQRKV
jgi:hypothetical protein